MFDFQVPKITMEEVSEDGKYGKFVVEPLERGYGLTLGNSLRRIMLSSLPGAAVSLVKFDGVLHEFSTIPGVKEDVTDIIMNIKSLHIKNESESDAPIVGYIDVKGDGVVTAEDIQVPPEVEIVNKDAVIATLSGGSDSKFLANGGLGAEYDFSEHLTAGFEVKYQYIKDFSRLPISLGLTYKF